MGRKKASPKVRKHLNKTRSKIAESKIEVYDEWEHSDRDRDEIEAGMKFRKKRWKEIDLDQKKLRLLEKKAIKEIEKMKRDTKGRPPTPLEEAWLRCDFLLSHIMDMKAYTFMEKARLNEPELYKYLYKQFMSPNMMHYAQYYVDYFAKGGKAPKIVTFGEVIKKFRKYRGIRSIIKIKRKGEDEKEL